MWFSNLLGIIYIFYPLFIPYRYFSSPHCHVSLLPTLNFNLFSFSRDIRILYIFFVLFGEIFTFSFTVVRASECLKGSTGKKLPVGVIIIIFRQMHRTKVVSDIKNAKKKKNVSKIFFLNRKWNFLPCATGDVGDVLCCATICAQQFFISHQKFFSWMKILWKEKKNFHKFFILFLTRCVREIG